MSVTREHNDAGIKGVHNLSRRARMKRATQRQLTDLVANRGLSSAAARFELYERYPQDAASMIAKAIG